MSTQPELFLTSDTGLVRRVPPRAREPRTGAVKAISFNLRPIRGETGLSFYLEVQVSSDELLGGAPGPGWGVVSVTVGDLEDVGFTVQPDPVEGEGELGRAHVLAVPSEYDAEGQVPLSIREELAARSRWVRMPVRAGAQEG